MSLKRLQIKYWASSINIVLAWLLAIGPTFGLTLQGVAEHVEELPPVGSAFVAGATFEPSQMPSLNPDNRWVVLPDWLCGSWMVDKETAVLRQDFTTGDSNTEPVEYHVESHFKYGQQIDAKGEIWHYLGVPYCSHTAVEFFTEYHWVTTKEVASKDDHTVTFRSRSIVVRVSKATGKVTDTYQQESLTTYSPADDGSGNLTLSASTKSFDAKGKPLRLTKNVGTVNKMKAFTPINFDDHNNLRELFVQFLAAKGMSELARADQ